MMCESIWQGAVQDSYNEKYDTITAQYSTTQYNTVQIQYERKRARALRKREPTTSSPRQPHAFLMPRCFWNPSPLTLLLTCLLTHKNSKTWDQNHHQPYNQMEL